MAMGVRLRSDARWLSSFRWIRGPNRVEQYPFGVAWPNGLGGEVTGLMTLRSQRRTTVSCFSAPPPSTTLAGRALADLAQSINHAAGSHGTPWRGWRRRSERGASLVRSFAVVAPVLFLLLFGVIDFGGLYSKQIGFRSGLRASTRQAVIARFGTDNSCPSTAGLSSSSKSVKPWCAR